MRPTMKLFSQFEHVANATPFALREEGKISDGIAQGTCAEVVISITNSGTRSRKLSSKTGLGIDSTVLLPNYVLRLRSWHKEGERTTKYTYRSP